MVELLVIIESYLMASSEGVSSEQIHELIQARYAQAYNDQDTADEEKKAALKAEIKFLKGVSVPDIEKTITELNTYYESSSRSFRILETAFGWKIYTTPEMAPYLSHLHPTPRAAKLSQPALETLAIIAYRQPITKAAIEAVRGVSSDGMVNKLVEAELVSVFGRADLPGRPLLYETTDFFYEHFGVKSIEDLPNSQELRNMAWPAQDKKAQEDDQQMQLGEFHQRQLEEKEE